MPCYSPYVAFKDYDAGLTENGKFRYRLNGKFDPAFVDMYPKGDVIKVPCGKCLGCQLDRSRTWADRMYLEYLSSGKKAIFITLTYDDKNVPKVIDQETGEWTGLTLDVRDTQLFWKNLRKKFHKSIRYFLCAEYGKKNTRRPHYHAIVFGLDMKEDFPDFIDNCLKVNELGQPTWTSKILEDIWDKGRVSLSPISYKTCAYVSRYCMKKAYGIAPPYKGALPEFNTMSRRPGIAANYISKLNEDGEIVIDDEKLREVCNKSHVYFNDGSSSYKANIPKYFLKKLQLKFPEEYNILLQERRSTAHDRDLLKLQQTELDYQENLDKEYEELVNKTQILFNLREEDF